MATSTASDAGMGLGLLFSLLAVGAALATAYLGHVYAVRHAVGEAARSLQITSGIAFGVAMLAAGLAVAALHAYEG